MIDTTLLTLLAQGPGGGEAAVAAGSMICMMILFVMIVILQILVLVFWVFMIIDCVKHEPQMPDNQMVLWILVIVLTGAIGAAIYYFVRRPQNRLGGVHPGSFPSQGSSPFAPQYPPQGDSKNHPYGSTDFPPKSPPGY